MIKNNHHETDIINYNSIIIIKKKKKKSDNVYTYSYSNPIMVYLDERKFEQPPKPIHTIINYGHPVPPNIRATKYQCNIFSQVHPLDSFAL